MERAALDIQDRVTDLFLHPRHSAWLIPVLMIMESAFCGLIIRTVNYTEIDWISYMQQVEQFIKGERDYSLIRGDTGPLVYPALHLYIYRGLHAITSEGQNIVLAQAFFVFVYVLNLGLAMLCYRQAKAPPYVYPMLVLSKRLHSIYVLRCFNDCFAMTGLFAAIYLYQRKQWTWGSILLSCGLGVKMNVLLVLPAVAVILFQAGGPMMLLTQTSWMAQVQLVIAMPFLRNHARAYFSQAFDMRRQFLYEWTVNWRFVPEEVFLSRNFAIGLVVAHATLLVFFLTTRWLKPMGNSLRVAFHYLLEAPSEDARKLIESRLTPDFILTTILTANTIGMLCARTLHPQFFSWIAWATPYLLWRSKLNPALVYVLWLGQELAWNQFPSTDLSSKIVVGVLAVAVLEIWIATDDEKPAPKNIPPEVLDQVQRHKASRQKQATVQEVPKKDSHRKQVTFHADVKADK